MDNYVDNFVDNVDNFCFGGSKVVTKLLHLAQKIYTLMSLFMTHLGILGQKYSQELCELSIQFIQFNWLISNIYSSVGISTFYRDLPNRCSQYPNEIEIS